MTATEQTGYFVCGTCNLYGTLHVPADSVHPPVLILPPFGEERKCAYRQLVLIARKLATAGHPCFRFDLRGTGESTGDHAEVDLDDWLKDAESALSMLRTTVDNRCWIAVGARFGANIAAKLAASCSAIDLVLIEPLLSGREYVEDLERRQQIKDMMSQRASGTNGNRNTSKTSTDRAHVEYGGYPVSEALASQMKEVTLIDDISGILNTCRVHLLHVSGARHFSRKWDSALELLHQAERDVKHKTHLLREKPFWGQIEFFESEVLPDAVFDTLHSETKNKDR